VLDESGAMLDDGGIGEIAIRSVSLFEGYRNQPQKTADVMREGWYLTGDYGFLDHGEIFVVGRKKDIIVVAGKNIYPEDIEDAVSQVPGVAAGRVVAFSIDDERSGTEQVCVVAEAAAEDEASKKRLRRAIVEAAMGIDITVARVYLAPLRWLIKSSAGKPSRRANRERALAELDFGSRRTE
jgi:acyl-CoA synthetase (AMP-forming)/AMP-acid ligase II